MPMDLSTYEEQLRRSIDGHVDMERRPVNAHICVDSRAALEAFATRFGVSVTALLDVAGHVMAALNSRTEEELHEMFVGIDDLLSAARTIDATRRRRRPEGTRSLGDAKKDATKSKGPRR
jgi:hypothetical protein